MTQDRHPFLPTAEEEVLLKACFAKGEEAPASWRAWRDSVDIEDIDLGMQRLLPLLYDNLRAHDVIDPVLSRYKSVYRHAWLQNQLQTRQAGEVLEVLAAAGLDGLLLKGIALIPLYYRRFGLRAMDDIDVLVRPETGGRAIDALRRAGWSVKDPDWNDHKIGSGHAVVLQRGPFELDLHWRVLLEKRSLAHEDFWIASQTIAILGKRAKTLSDTDHLLHTCAHGARLNSVSPVRWVADAAVILRSASIDWGRLLYATQTLGLVLPVRETLAYVERTLHCSVPAHVIAELQAMPVTRHEKFDFETRLSHPGFSRDVLHYYRERARTARGARSPLAFIRNVQTEWGMRTMTETVVEAIRRIIRLYRRHRLKRSRHDLRNRAGAPRAAPIRSVTPRPGTPPQNTAPADR
jgi:hypothetical protein